MRVATRRRRAYAIRPYSDSSSRLATDVTWIVGVNGQEPACHRRGQCARRQHLDDHRRVLLLQPHEQLVRYIQREQRQSATSSDRQRIIQSRLIDGSRTG